LLTATVGAVLRSDSVRFVVPSATPHFIASEPLGFLVDIASYWAGKRAGGAMPARADICPFELRRNLAYIILLDVVGAPPRFRKRLVGSAIVAKEGFDSTGNWLDETVRNDIRDAVLAQHLEAVQGRRMSCYTVSFVGKDGKNYRYQRLLLPLSADGETVNMLFGAVQFFDRASQ
jgi:hypothetical protein